MRPILPFIIKGKFGNHRFIIVPSTTRFKRRMAGKSLFAYATYAKGWQPEEVVEMDHTDIARRLMLEHGLTQGARTLLPTKFCSWRQESTIASRRLRSATATCEETISRKAWSPLFLKDDSRYQNNICIRGKFTGPHYGACGSSARFKISVSHVVDRDIR